MYCLLAFVCHIGIENKDLGSDLHRTQAVLLLVSASTSFDVGQGGFEYGINISFGRARARREDDTSWAVDDDTRNHLVEYLIFLWAECGHDYRAIFRCDFEVSSS